ncbi:MAG: glucose-6-phosphate dehydrogenase assembly protein OpcA [bacterium]|nr:glucose-6-phosphate dehydrogenase assembly protein OpcA [bacterium]
MTTIAGPQLFRTSAHAANPGELQQALTATWQELGAAGNDVARAVTINFVAVGRAGSDGAAATADMQGALDHLIRRSPARAFLVTIDAAAARPAVEVRAIARDRGSSRHVLLESIAVRLPPSWSPHVPGLVRPLLINDLPTHVYWADDWHDSAAFDAMRALGDHTVVDSRRFTLPAVQLPELHRARTTGGPVTDLDWLRLRPWRRACAEGFERLHFLPGTTVQGVIRHGRGGTSTATLLAHWLESRLGAQLALEEGETPDSALENVTLRFAEQELEVTRTGSCVLLKASTPAVCYLPLRLPGSRGNEGELLAAAIDIA